MNGIEMINMDAWLLAFVKTNLVTIGAGIMFLKGLAKMTPWSHDDSIVELISGAFSQITRKK
ncbi:MAG: hypothetical protein GY846_26390 [Deltaproteobacteria bacterium]|nr:hypothetical protein [Deltaproteobacteria bacterium]